MLKSTIYGEADVLVSLLTRRAGRIRAVAKGAMRSKKRFMNCLDLFGLVWVSLEDKGRDLLRLDSCDLISRPEMGGDAFRLGLACLAVEAADMFCPEQEPAPIIYSLLAQTLELLPGHSRPKDLCLTFLLRLLHESGFGPAMEGCLSCGLPLDKAGRLGLHPLAGGLICENCKPDLPALSQGAIRTVIRCQQAETESLPRLSFPAAELDRIFQLTGLSLTARSERELKSLAYLRKLKSGNLKNGRSSRARL